MKLPAYPRYKPSGVEWLGDVPEHWVQIALRRTSTRYAGGTPDRSNDSYWDEGTIPWINSGAVNQGLITEPSAFITEEAYRNSSARWVAKGALVMALAGQGKTKGMVAQTGISTTCNQSMASICPAPPMQARYMYWLLVGQYEHIRNMAGGEARDGLNLEILGSIPCLKVPPAEQRAIAAFLDRETGRVDRLVAKKRELIERLKEKRTALISRTVTRGLPPAAGLPANPPLKPSGTEWLGDIPEHWEVKKGRYVGILFGSVAPTEDELIEDDSVQDGDLPFAKVDDLNAIDGSLKLVSTNARARGCRARKGSLLLFPKRGAAIFTNKVAIADQPVLFDSNLMGWQINSTFAIKFVAYCLIARRLDDLADVSTVPQINNKHIYPAAFPRPPLPEQAAIATYLDLETAKLDALVAKVEEAVERLQECRTALITAAVTGKIDVREVATP